MNKEPRDINSPAMKKEFLAWLEVRDELEVWHRGWITKLMTGDATSEEYNAAIPPHPDPHHPENDE